MDTGLLRQEQEFKWVLAPRGSMRVPGIIFATESLIRAMEPKVLEQVSNIASLPGIVDAAYTMPDAHWGYGFPIGGVAAFDPDAGGVVSAGGVGFDIACGVRSLVTNLSCDEAMPKLAHLADALFRDIPAGVGKTGPLQLGDDDLMAMLAGGARWAVDNGYGLPEDLKRIEYGGCIPDARPVKVSTTARQRQTGEMGTLGAGNHYLEVQKVTDIFDQATAAIFGLRAGQVVISIHCGSRGLGHQVATDYSRSMIAAANRYKIRLNDRELACAPIYSPEGQSYLGAMRSAGNCAMANRQILAHRVRSIIQRIWPSVRLDLLYDVSHNFCAEELYSDSGQRPRRLFVHRKGATRAYGPGHETLPPEFKACGQPVLVGGTMGTASYILTGNGKGFGHGFSSACHGAGRALSRSEATRRFRGEDVVKKLALRDILIRSRSFRGVAEEAPGAYKDVDEVIRATATAGLACPVAKLAPMIAIKG